MKDRALTHCMEENTMKQTNILHGKIPKSLPHQKENLFPPVVEERETTTET